MIQFRSHRRLFSRHRSSGKLRTILAVALILSFGVAAYSHMGSGTGADTSVPAVQPQVAAFTPIQPNIIEPRIQEIPPLIMAVAEPVKPPTPLPASRESLTTEISGNISDMLEPGTKALTSAKKVVVRKGDDFLSVLKKAGVPGKEAQQIALACKKECNPRGLRPGREITAFFHQQPSVADQKLVGVSIETGALNTVTVHREDSGRYTVNKKEKEVHRALRGFKGTIDSSFYVDAKAAGVPDSVIIGLIKMYSWNVDFQREIHSGDKFEVMYEEYKTEDDKTVRGKGDILYARLTLDGEELPFYRYEDRNGDADYFDDNGRSAKKPLMKTPIDGARLSSGFGMRRHPVLGYSKMHKGADFAAPRGTPIYAAGDGKIEKMGPYSSYGNYIRIRHRNDLKTAYAHMKGFKAGLRVGSRVKQGQIIGYVGTTGRSTGPHLHYEVLVRNAQVNPKSVKLPTGTSLKGKDLNSFKSLMARTRDDFRNISQPTAVAVAQK